MSLLCYRDPDGNWPRYVQDIKDHTPGWVVGEDLPDGWGEVTQEDDFEIPLPVDVTFVEGTGDPLPENVRFATEFKGYDLDVVWDDSQNRWEATSVLNETAVEYPEPVPREWFINGEWTTDPYEAG